jgi:large subunit ribosomal protein L20
MPRSVNHVASKQRRKKVLKMAKGYFGRRKNVWTVAKNAVEKGLTYAYRDRKQHKRNMRSIWIVRINAAIREHGMTYSEFIGKLNAKNVGLNRKALADLAMNHPEVFKAIVNEVKDAVPVSYAKSAAAATAKETKAVKSKASTGAKTTKKVVKIAEPKVEKKTKTVEEAPVAKKEIKKEKVVETPESKVKDVEKADDLKKIEGIGPAIAKILGESGISSFADLASKSAEDIRGILEEAGSRYKSHDPTTWPQQSSLAAKGKWDELKALQDELSGGRANA